MLNHLCRRWVILLRLPVVFVHFKQIKCILWYLDVSLLERTDNIQQQVEMCVFLSETPWWSPSSQWVTCLYFGRKVRLYCLNNNSFHESTVPCQCCASIYVFVLRIYFPLFFSLVLLAPNHQVFLLYYQRKWVTMCTKKDLQAIHCSLNLNMNTLNAVK